MQFDPITDIIKCHRHFGLSYEGPSRELPEELAKFRLKFLVEELCEYTLADVTAVVDAMASVLQREMKPAITTEARALKLDALVDLAYVLFGTIYLHGWSHIFPEAWARVHAANMQKVRAKTVDESKRASLYDIVKPAGWIAPTLEDLV